MVSTAYLGKVRGSGKGAAPYPQPEGELGECMSKHGRGLGESAFGHALVDCGEAFRQMADIKYNMEDTIKQNFLDPLTVLQTKDLKETVVGSVLFLFCHLFTS
jgi:endophilin-A